MVNSARYLANVVLKGVIQLKVAFEIWGCHHLERNLAIHLVMLSLCGKFVRCLTCHRKVPLRRLRLLVRCCGHHFPQIAMTQRYLVVGYKSFQK